MDDPDARAASRTPPVRIENPTQRFAEELLAALAEHADAERAERERAYLKSDRVHLGVRVPVVRRVMRDVVRRRPPQGSAAPIARADALWASDVYEACLAATQMVADAHAAFGPDDLDHVERWIRGSHTWALVDVLAPHLVGAMLERDPKVDATLADWAVEDDPWLRRSALLAYLGPLRRGEDVFGAFVRHADVLLEDRSFWVRKALGWTLRERTKCRPDEVVAWLAPRASRASSLTVREATRRLPEAWRVRFVADSA